MSGSIFEVQTLDRARCDWASKLRALTPWEKRGGCWLKREDYFAPLGQGGINGAKLRQCIWLGREAASSGRPGWVSGASVKSPQLSMGTAVARHFGMASVHVVGATKVSTAMRHPNVEVAAWMGARFDIQPVGYNPVLQARVTELLEGQLAGWGRLEYGISVDHEVPGNAGDVDEFHHLGAEQVRDMPPEVETLLVPAGSCNSAVSVLFGLTRYPSSVRRVVLFGIGPTRLQWIEDRLGVLEAEGTCPVRARFKRVYHQHPGLAEEHDRARLAHNRFLRWEGESRTILLEHHDLHEQAFASYQDEMPYRFEGVDMHPTYEGKVWTYMMAQHLAEFGPLVRSGRAGFWIVGGRPSPAAMLPHLRACGERPATLPLLGGP